MNLAEVDRLWLRFKQLGCSDNGELTEEKLSKHPVYQDAFSRRVGGLSTRGLRILLREKNIFVETFYGHYKSISDINILEKKWLKNIQNSESHFLCFYQMKK